MKVSLISDPEQVSEAGQSTSRNDQRTRDQHSKLSHKKFAYSSLKQHFVNCMYLQPKKSLKCGLVKKVVPK